MMHRTVLFSVALAAGVLTTVAAQPPVAAPAGPATTPATVRILLVGDSTVTDDSGWGRGFKARWSDRVTCVNLARNGRSSKSFIDEGHWSSALNEPADYVLIQFGHNDQPGKGPERETDAATSFRDYLRRYVREARSAGKRPVLVTSLTRRHFNNGRIVTDLGTYADATKAVAADVGVPLIDLHALSIALLDRLGPERSGAFGLLKPDYSYDSTHLSEPGSQAFGDLVATELARLVPALAPHLRPSGLTWSECASQPADWYGGAEAGRVAGNVLLYQRATGGWPKNLDMARVLDAAERARVMADSSKADSTIDNGATTTPLRFLARVHAAAPSDAYRQAFLAGVDYLLAAQYANGGWPQYFPLRSDYSRHVTFNDDAMVNVLELLQDVAAGDAPFGFVDAGRRARAAAAVTRGIQLILTTQVRVDDRLTAWAAQYDAVTLQPAAARTFEPVALSADESATIVRFLKALPQPSPDVRAAVEGAVAWFRSVQLSSLRTESRNDANSPRGWERVVVSDPAAGPLWARFYEIGTNLPVFADRDGVVRYRLDALGYERRTGYAWYGTWPADLVR